MKAGCAEDRFMVACLRCFLGDPPPCPSDARGVEWGRFVARAEVQRAEGAIWWGLNQRQATDLLPPEITQAFQTVHYEQMGRFMLLAQATEEVVGALHARDVPAVCLKGIALAPAMYPSPGVRPMSDVDLLVPEDAGSVASDTLLQSGYRLAPEVMPDDWEEEIHHHTTPFLRGQIEFEIHRNIAILSHPVASRIDVFWQRVQPLPAMGRHALRLCPSDMLVHLCLHCGFRWTGAQLLNLVDLQVMLRAEGRLIDWHSVCRHAQRRDVARQLYYPLALADDLFGPRVPPAVMRALQRRACPSRMEQKLLLDLVMSTGTERRAVPLTIRLAQSEAICANEWTSARWLPLLLSLIAPPPQTYPRLQQEASDHPLVPLVRYTARLRGRMAGLKP